MSFTVEEKNELISAIRIALKEYDTLRTHSNPNIKISAEKSTPILYECWKKIESE